MNLALLIIALSACSQPFGLGIENNGNGLGDKGGVLVPVPGAGDDGSKAEGPVADGDGDANDNIDEDAPAQPPEGDDEVVAVEPPNEDSNKDGKITDEDKKAPRVMKDKKTGEKFCLKRDESGAIKMLAAKPKAEGEKDEGANKNEKFTLCHIPPGNPGNKHTIKVGSLNAVAAHKKHHDDYTGACRANPEEDDGEAPVYERCPVQDELKSPAQ